MSPPKEGKLVGSNCFFAKLRNLEFLIFERTQNVFLKKDIL